MELFSGRSTLVGGFRARQHYAYLGKIELVIKLVFLSYDSSLFDKGLETNFTIYSGEKPITP